MLDRVKRDVIVPERFNVNSAQSITSGQSPNVEIRQGGGIIQNLASASLYSTTGNIIPIHNLLSRGQKMVEKIQVQPGAMQMLVDSEFLDKAIVRSHQARKLKENRHIKQ